MVVNFTFGQNFESFYEKALRSKIKIVKNDDMISGEIMFITIQKDYLEVSVESEIRKEYCGEIVYPSPKKLVYTKNNNSLVVENNLEYRNNRFRLISLTLREEKIFGTLKIDNNIEEFEFK